jgi:hypothetical protein
MAEADDEVDSESNGCRIKENSNIVQKNGKRSKVEYTYENVTLCLVGVWLVNEQLIKLPILRNPFEISKLVEKVLGRGKAVRIMRGGLV